MRSIDWHAVRTACVVGLGLLAGPIIAAGLLLDGDSSGAWAWLFLVATILGLFGAGFVAGWLRSDTPMLHGGLSAALVFGIVQVVAVIIGSPDDTGFSWSAFALTALLALCAGVGGGVVADWTRRRSSRDLQNASTRTLE